MGSLRARHPGSKTTANERLVPEESLLDPGLLMVARRLLPPSPSDSHHFLDGAITIGSFAFAYDRESSAVDDEMNAFARGNSPKRKAEVLTAPRRRRVIRRGQAEAHQLEQQRQEAFGLAERQVEEKTQRQGRFDGDVRVLPCPARRFSPSGVHAAIASADSYTVRSPRQTRACS